MTDGKYRLRDLLVRASTTQPSMPPVENVVPHKKWDDLHADIKRAQSRLTTATGEEHRALNAHESAVQEVQAAEMALCKAMEVWVERTRTQLGINVVIGGPKPNEKPNNTTADLTKR